MANLVRRALALATDVSPEAVDEGEVKDALDRYQAHYASRLGRETRLFPGMIEGLARLAAKWGFRSRSITNKATRFVRPHLVAAGIEHYFAVVIGGDDLPAKKPDPAPLRHVAAVFGIPPARLLMVGDSGNDVAGGARRRLPGAGRALRLPRRQAGARPRGRWYSRVAGRGRRPRPLRRPRVAMSFDLSSLRTLSATADARGGTPRRWRRCRAACWRRASTAAAGVDVRASASRAASDAPAQSADCPSSPNRRDCPKRHDRSRIPRACRQGLQPHPARPRDVRRPRHAAVALRQARQRAATRSCWSRSSAASASAATRSSACRAKIRIRARGTAIEVDDDGDRRRAARRRSARVRRRRSCAATARRRVPACRASAAGSPASSATTPCATSRRSSPAARRRRRRARRRARHPAAPHRGARGRRQPRGQDLPHRLRRSRRSRMPTRRRATRLQALRRKLREPVVDPVPDGDRRSRRRKASSAREGYQARGARARRTTSPPAT